MVKVPGGPQGPSTAAVTGEIHIPLADGMGEVSASLLADGSVRLRDSACAGLVPYVMEFSAEEWGAVVRTMAQLPVPGGVSIVEASVDPEAGYGVGSTSRSAVGFITLVVKARDPGAYAMSLGETKEEAQARAGRLAALLNKAE